MSQIEVDLDHVTVIPRTDVRARIEAAMKRLYSEMRMDADEMRDMAQSLEVFVEAIFVP